MCKNWFGHKYGNWEKVKEETLLYRNVWDWFDDKEYSYKKWILMQKRTCTTCYYVQIDKQEINI